MLIRHMNKLSLSLLSLIFMISLMACGGRGGGESSNSGVGSEKALIQTSVGSFETPALAATYSFSSAPGYTLSVHYLYPIDLNNDGVDELLVAGLTPVNFNPNPVKTCPTATLGAYYDIAKNQRFGVTGIYRQEAYQAVSTTTVMATYTVGL